MAISNWQLAKGQGLFGREFTRTCPGVPWMGANTENLFCRRFTQTYADPEELNQKHLYHGFTQRNTDPNTQAGAPALHELRANSQACPGVPWEPTAKSPGARHRSIENGRVTESDSSIHFEDLDA